MASGNSAGALNERVHCQVRSAVDDGLGNTVTGDFATQFTVAAGFKYAGGGEAVQAARLEGRTIIKVLLRSSSQTRQITED